MRSNSKGLAVKIKAILGQQITAACKGSIVPVSFLAGLISVENAQVNPLAYRFERGVYDKLKALRNPLKFWRREWNGITPADLKGLSDDALVNLSTSFGYTQIMGWWAIVMSKRLTRSITVADIRDPKKHLDIAVLLLNLTARRHLTSYAYGDTLRIWNTGSSTGKTYDPDYVPNALAVMNDYKKTL